MVALVLDEPIEDEEAPSIARVLVALARELLLALLTALDFGSAFRLGTRRERRDEQDAREGREWMSHRAGSIAKVAVTPRALS